MIKFRFISVPVNNRGDQVALTLQNKTQTAKILWSLPSEYIEFKDHYLKVKLKEQPPHKIELTSRG